MQNYWQRLARKVAVQLERGSHVARAGQALRVRAPHLDFMSVDFGDERNLQAQFRRIGGPVRRPDRNEDLSSGEKSAIGLIRPTCRTPGREDTVGMWLKVLTRLANPGPTERVADPAAPHHADQVHAVIG
jgi:hypothetical protein